jgi:hypothetical protein
MRLTSSVDHFFDKKGEKKRVDTRKKYDVKLRPVRGEPSDINWENLNLSKNQQFMRGFIATFVVSMFLLFSIVGTAAAQAVQLELKKQTGSCEAIEEK